MNNSANTDNLVATKLLLSTHIDTDGRELVKLTLTDGQGKNGIETFLIKEEARMLAIQLNTLIGD